MAKRNLAGSYVYQGQTYGPGEVELPEGDEHKSFMERLDKYEQQAKRDAEADVQRLLSQLPAGHVYASTFAANASQPDQFTGEPSRIVAAPSGMMANQQPQGATVSGIEQEGEAKPSEPQRRRQST